MNTAVKQASPFLEKYKSIVGSVTVALLLLSIVSMFSFYDYSNMPDFLKRGNEKKELLKLIRSMKTNKIKHAVTTRGMQQWIIMFYSNEEIICRYTKMNDRYPPYVAAVNKALAQKERVAVVGYYGVFRGLHQSKEIMQNSTFINQKYFYFPFANQQLLSQLGYEFE